MATNPTTSTFVSDDCLEDMEFLANDGGFDVLSSDVLPPPPQGKPNTTKKHLFGPQENHDDAGMPVAQAARASIISPGTLKRVASQAIEADDIIPGGKKVRKRGKKPKLDASSQNPVPDMVPAIKCHEVTCRHSL